MNPKDIARVAFAGIAIVSAVVVVKDHHKVVKTERAKREQIKLNTQRELLALARANLVVQKKVLAGGYSPNPIVAFSDMNTDMKFYRIVDRFND
jgi:hypothetical protein